MAKTYEITARATITLDTEHTLVEAADGRIVAIEFPDGSRLKPWVVMEHMTFGPEGEQHRNLSWAETVALLGEGGGFEDDEQEIFTT